jgi:hypothetical protein
MVCQRAPHRIKGGAGDPDAQRSIVAGRITSLHDDYIVVGNLRIRTQVGMMTKGLTIGASVTVTVTRLDGTEVAERIEVLKDSFKP